MWAIIGGSGFEKFEAFEARDHLSRETPFGLASSGLKRGRLSGTDCLFLPRHGEHHEQLPSEVNYAANIFALKKAGALGTLSFSAIGSLREELRPGDLVVPSQYIDRTKGRRRHSFCGDGVVGHVSLAHPVAPPLVAALKTRVPRLVTQSWSAHFDKTYVCIEGPQFSTQAESHHYRTLGADVIGMTAFPEYALAREAGLPYLPCCFVTDYDCWDDRIAHVTLEGVLEIMRLNNQKALQLATEILQLPSTLLRECQEAEPGLKTGLLTPVTSLPHEASMWLEIIRS